MIAARIPQQHNWRQHLGIGPTEEIMVRPVEGAASDAMPQVYSITQKLIVGPDGYYCTRCTVEMRKAPEEEQAPTSEVMIEELDHAGD